LLQFHRTGEEPLRDDEISILSGALELSTKKVECMMTTMEVLPASRDTAVLLAQISRSTLSPSVQTPSSISHVSTSCGYLLTATFVFITAFTLTCLHRRQSGFSRVPIHEPGQPLIFIGILLVKTVRMSPLLQEGHSSFFRLWQLLGYDPAKALPVSAFPLCVLPEASPSINCFQALDYL
jgi:metal transporter CNNM